MKQVKEILAVLLMLYIITGILVLLYRSLIWHSFSASFSYSLLMALALLKGVLIRLRGDRTEEKLSRSDRSTLLSWLRVSLILFCFLLLLAYLFKGQQIAALVVSLCLIATILCPKFIMPSTRNNP